MATNSELKYSKDYDTHISFTMFRTNKCLRGRREKKKQI